MNLNVFKDNLPWAANMAAVAAVVTILLWVLAAGAYTFTDIFMNKKVSPRGRRIWYGLLVSLAFFICATALFAGLNHVQGDGALFFITLVFFAIGLVLLLALDSCREKVR